MREYRVRQAPLIVSAVVGALLGQAGLVAYQLTIYQPHQVLGGVVAGWIAGGTFGALALSYLSKIPVRLHHDSIEYIDCWGRSRRIPWVDIHGCSRWSLLSMSFVKLHTPQRSLSIPSHLHDLEGFASSVLESAGEEHPLAKELSRAAASRL